MEVPRLPPCGRPALHARARLHGAHQEIASEASLFDAIRVIAEHDAVLVRAPDKTYSGIVTAHDIARSSSSWQSRSFYLVISRIISGSLLAAFAVAELQQVKDPDDAERIINDVSDLTFGEYVRLLQNEANWAKLRMRIDRTTFVAWLDKVREIRNDIMHFDPDPIEPTDMQLLKACRDSLSAWHELSS